jgi:hypothetical protein
MADDKVKTAIDVLARWVMHWEMLGLIEDDDTDLNRFGPAIGRPGARPADDWADELDWSLVIQRIEQITTGLKPTRDQFNAAYEFLAERGK